MKARSSLNPLAKPDPVTLEIKRLGALIERKDYAKAEAGAHSLLHAHPKRPDVHSILGLACLWQKRLTQAIPHLEFAAKAEPGNTYYLSNLGRLYLDLTFVELACRSSTKLWRSILNSRRLCWPLESTTRKPARRNWRCLTSSASTSSCRRTTP